MDNKVSEANNRIKEIKIQLQRGELDYDEAKEKAEPYIKVLNSKGREVARAFKKPYHELTFSGLMR